MESAPTSFPDCQYDVVVCRYSEIGTKGRNRGRFEEQLVSNILRKLKDAGALVAQREPGRVYLRPGGEAKAFTPEQLGVVRRQLPKVFGLSSASPAFAVPPTVGAVEAAVQASFPEQYEAIAATSPGDIPYATRARRNWRGFPMASKELEVGLTEDLLPRYPRLQVDLRHARLQINIEIRPRAAFIWYETVSGPGGLPTGTGGRLLALLSGGIDSPVACYHLMRRGCQLDFVTFHSSPYTPEGTIRKVADIARRLGEFQGQNTLFAVNLLPAQRAIKEHCTERFRTVLYRRLMVRIATVLATQCRALALVTGDNLGQVASQTLVNLATVSAATEMTIMRPLIGAEKSETVEVANAIGTFDLSKEPMPDSCTVFAPASPATNAPVQRILQEEAKLDLPALVTACLADARIVNCTDYTMVPIAGPDENPDPCWLTPRFADIKEPWQVGEEEGRGGTCQGWKTK